MSDALIELVSILGTPYSIKVPAGQEQKLRDASALLKTILNDTKRQFPNLMGDKLLVIAALNLCSRQLDQQREHQLQLGRYQEQVSATVERISRTIAET
ncbi:cell division protein ZapA [Pseudomonas sp. dw_358]|uniref:cell division protein ZapA n=1 Tax=Pseudomonas sp. dw_358 TaxID=2720083 RepID=UPI001BD5A1C2|nr:cell division protein ZapA [Pseudomonas sp. dw_358]